MHVVLRGTLLVALLAFTGCGGDEQVEPAPGGTQSGTVETSTVDADADYLQAIKAVVTDDDLKGGWDALDPADEVIPAEIGCFDLSEEEMSAEARGQTYSAGGPVYLLAGAPFPRASHAVASVVHMYETEAAAHQAFSTRDDQLQDLNLIGRCLYLADDIPDGPAISRVEGGIATANSFPLIGDETRGAEYLVHLKKDRKSSVTVDVVLMRAGRAVAVAFFSSVTARPLSSPFSYEFIIGTAERMGERL